MGSGTESLNGGEGGCNREPLALLLRQAKEETYCAGDDVAENPDVISRHREHSLHLEDRKHC